MAIGGGRERELHALRGERGAVHRHVEVRRRDRRGRRGVDDRAGRAHRHDGPVDALAERQVLAEEVADVGDHLAVHDERLRVDEVRHLRGRAGEVEVQRVAFHRERARQLVLLVAPLDPAGHRVGAAGETGDAVAQHRLRGVAHRGEGVRELIDADGLHHRRELRRRHVAPGDEPAQVHLHEAGQAHVGEDEVPRVAALDPGGEQAHRREADCLLVALGGVGCPRAECHAADVDQVRRRRDPPDEGFAHEHGTADLDVLRVVAATAVRVVGDEHVARCQRGRVARQRVLDEVAGAGPLVLDLAAAREQLARGAEDVARVVLALGDDRAHRGLLDGDCTLVDHRLEPAAGDLEQDRVDARAHRAAPCVASSGSRISAPRASARAR